MRQNKELRVTVARRIVISKKNKKYKAKTRAENKEANNRAIPFISTSAF